MKLAILRHLKQTCKILVDDRRPVESRGRAIEIQQGGAPDQMRFGPLYTLISVTTL